MENPFLSTAGKLSLWLFVFVMQIYTTLFSPLRLFSKNHVHQSNTKKLNSPQCIERKMCFSFCFGNDLKKKKFSSRK